MSIAFEVSGYLFELSPELWPQCSDEEHEAQFIKLNTGGRRGADTGGHTLDETRHEPDGNKTNLVVLKQAVK